MPFSTFIAQNFGAGRYDRIHRGVRSAFVTAVVFSLLVSVLVFIFAKPLMLIFVRPDETEIIAVGVAYLRIEGAFYCGIGILFFAVRILPGHPYAGHVCCADRAVAGHPCSSFLTGLLRYRDWGDGHLVVHPHRLADCRRGRYLVLSVC